MPYLLQECRAHLFRAVTGKIDVRGLLNTVPFPMLRRMSLRKEISWEDEICGYLCRAWLALC
jgi:hypothetical protein